jgi:hypothetical protein
LQLFGDADASSSLTRFGRQFIGQALSLIDERADARQRTAIEQLVGGKVGGPWERRSHSITRKIYFCLAVQIEPDHHWCPRVFISAKGSHML